MELERSKSHQDSMQMTESTSKKDHESTSPFRDCITAPSDPNHLNQPTGQCPVPRNSLQSSLNSVMSLFSKKPRIFFGQEQPDDCESMSEFINEIRSTHVTQNDCVHESPVNKSEMTTLLKPYEGEERSSSTQNPVICEELLLLANEQQMLLKNQRQRLASLQTELNHYKIQNSLRRSLPGQEPNRNSAASIFEGGKKIVPRSARLNSIDNSIVSVDEPELYQTAVFDLKTLPYNSPLIEPDFLLNVKPSHVSEEGEQLSVIPEQREPGEWRVCLLKMVPDNYLTRAIFARELNGGQLERQDSCVEMERTEIKPTRVQKLLAKISRKHKNWNKK